MKGNGIMLRGWLTVAFISFVFFTSTVHPVMAQTAGGWVPDQRVPGYSHDTFTPVLVADQNRTVHAFASQWVDYGERQLVVVYRQWSLAGGWTTPVDILLPPTGGEAQIQAAFLDSSGIVHVIFWAGSAQDAYIYYSRAPVANADQGSAWLAPIAIGERAIEPVSASISGDGQGNLVVIYDGNVDGVGVYEVRSTDSGTKWSRAEPLFISDDAGLSPYSIRLYPGWGNQLHASWNMVTSLGVDISLYYARYDFVQKKWLEPVMLNKRIEIKDYFGPSFPALVDNGEDVVIMYNNGNPFTSRPVDAGRPVQMVSASNDGGQTWKDPVVPFYRLVGRSGEHSLAVDGNDVVHALFTQRVEYTVDGENREIGGMWHSAYQNGIWSDPDRFITTYSPHDVRSVVSQGNVLLVVWRQDPGEGSHGIWYSYMLLDSPESPIVVPPTPVNEPVTTPTATPEADAMVVSIPPTQIPAITVNDAPGGFATNPAGPLLIAGVVVVIILAGVVVIYQSYLKRNN